MQKDKKNQNQRNTARWSQLFVKEKTKPANLILNLYSPVPMKKLSRQELSETEHTAGARREGEQVGHRDLVAALRKGRERLDRQRACEKVGSGKARMPSRCALLLRRSRAMLRCPPPSDKLVVVPPERDTSLRNDSWGAHEFLPQLASLDQMKRNDASQCRFLSVSTRGKQRWLVSWLWNSNSLSFSIHIKQ
jgi:hypothetical protein